MRTVRDNPGQFKAGHIGRYLIRKSVDVFAEGQIVTGEISSVR